MVRASGTSPDFTPALIELELQNEKKKILVQLYVMNWLDEKGRKMPNDI